MTKRSTIKRVERELRALTRKRYELNALLIVDDEPDADEVTILTSGPEFDLVQAELQKLDDDFDDFLRETLSANEYAVYARELAAEGAN